jgi:dTDP-4-dehydrorhamnose reductase
MRIFVTGEKGQLARCLADVTRGYDAYDMVFAGRPGFDLANAADAERHVVALRPDMIVNAAAYTAVDKAEAEPADALAINRDGAAAMARAAAKLDIPLIHVSTDYVFAGDKPAPYVETDATGPMGLYGQSKLEGEIVVREVTDKHLILRTAWVYSVYGANFVKTMLRVGAGKPELRVVDDQIGNPTSAHDLAAAIISVCQKTLDGSTRWGTYHMAGQGEVTWFGFAQRIFAAAGQSGFNAPRLVPIATQDYPTPAKRPANSRLDCAKLKAAFGVQLPPWTTSTDWCVKELLAAGRNPDG